MNAFKNFTNNLQATKNPALYKKLIDSNYSRFIKWEKQNQYPFLYSRSSLFSVFFEGGFQFYKKRAQQFPVFINTNKNKTRLKTSVKGEPYTTNLKMESSANKQNKNTFSHYYKAKDMKWRFINLLMVSGKKKKANQIFVTAENKFTLILEKVMESEKRVSITPLSPSLQKEPSNEKISVLVLSQIKLKTELLVSRQVKRIEKTDLFLQPLQKKYKKGDFKIEQGQSNHVEGQGSTLLGTKSMLSCAPIHFKMEQAREQTNTGTGSGAEKNGKKGGLSAYLQKAVENVTPNLEIRKVRIGRKTYQVPALISQKKGEGLAIRWIIDAATQSNKNSKKDFSDSLAQELLLAYNKKGQARQKRDELNKIAQANRAYIRYRWW